MSRKNFGEKTKALEIVKDIDLTGYEVIVTGGASGIGIETARALAESGARVVIPARDLSKAESVAENIRKSTGNQKVEVEKLELDRFDSVNEFCKRYLEKKRPLHILINNAGVAACPLAYTKDGFENQFGTNYMGHFALTLGLIPALKEAAKLTGKKSRVISVTSSAHAASDINFDDINFKNRKYDRWIAYSQSKTANSLFSVALTKHYFDEGIVSNAVMPGIILTNIQRHMSREEMLNFKMIDEKGNPILDFKSPEQGASTSVWAAVAAELEGVSGKYFDNCTYAKLKSNKEVMIDNNGYVKYALDELNALKLWDLSLKWLKNPPK